MRLRDALEARGRHVGADRPQHRARAVHLAALRRRAAAAEARLRRPRLRPSTARSRARPPRSRSSSFATSRSTARRCFPSTGSELKRVAVLGRLAVDRQPRRRRVERRLGARGRHRARRASRRRCLTPTSCTTTALTSKRPHTSPAMPTSPSSWSGTPTRTRVSTSATRAVDLRSLMPEKDDPAVVDPLRGRDRDPTTCGHA